MRAFQDVKIKRYVVNKSSRNGVKPRLIVIHDTEGANIKGIADLRGLGDFFDRSAVQASSHVATDAEGQSARYVRDTDKAWHCAGYNSVSLGIEQIGFASQTKWPAAQIDETARWVAHWSRHYKIPIRRGRVAFGRVLRSGVVTHAQLGAIGGGHHDPGKHYPFKHMLKRAKHFKKLQRERD